MHPLFRRAPLRSLMAALAVGVVVTPAVPGIAAAKPHTASRQLGDRALRVGARGADVRELQRLLRKVGIAVKVDGRFGASVKRGVQRFQRAAGLEASGTVGAVTIEALRRAALGGASTTAATGGFDETAASTRTRSLGDRIPVRQGMSGHDVKVLQDFLVRLGFKTGIDGEFGAGTVKAVRRFEKASGLSADGVVDARDLEALRGQVEPEAGDDVAPAAPPAGGAAPAAPAPLAPGDRAKLGADGMAIAPASAPEAIKEIIAAGNEIAKTPYIYGGGHGRWKDRGYDCSGSVSYALHGAGLLKSSLVSGDFPSWGTPGAGKWVTIYGNGGHVFMYVAGLRFDTSGAGNGGSRWQTDKRSSAGYGVSHPTGL